MTLLARWGSGSIDRARVTTAKIIVGSYLVFTKSKNLSQNECCGLYSCTCILNLTKVKRSNRLSNHMLGELTLVLLFIGACQLRLDIQIWYSTINLAAYTFHHQSVQR